LPVRRVADFAIGAPSLYARKQPVTTVVATASEGAGISGVAYDSVHDRLIAKDRARLLMFDVSPERMKDGPNAIAVFGQPNFTDRLTTGVGPKRMGSTYAANGGLSVGTVLDERNQRLFSSDGANNRILVWDIEPSRLTPTPDPMVVLGQKDVNTRTPSSGAEGLNTPASLFYDDANDRLFAVDSGNNRVVVYDARPQSLKTGMKAMVVIGQVDFDSRSPGLGPNRLSRPARLMHDPSHQRLFVGDPGNNRILVFDVAPARTKTGMNASYVFGQNDFVSNKPRTNLKKATGTFGPLQMDPVRQRLFVTELISSNRMLVFDIHPARIRNNPDAIAVVFQKEQERFVDKVGQDEETWPRPWVDPQRGKLYVAASHPGGNRVSFFDISGELPPAGLKAITSLGHVDGDGNVDFEGRAAAGRANGRVFYPRSLTLDPIDHRLFVADQYNNRVLKYDLDSENRIASRDATVIFGQPDNYTVKLWDPGQNTLKDPFGLAYDDVDKRLFIGDGWNNRVMVFDAHPDRLKESMPDAIAVIGQPTYDKVLPGAVARNRVNFKMAHPDLRTIGGGGPASLAMAVDTKNKRLFLSDGGNNRVLVFDTKPGALKPGVDAIGVIGQDDFTSTTALVLGRSAPMGGEEGGELEGGGRNALDAVDEAAQKDPVRQRSGFSTPGGIAYDAERERLFVVDGNNARVLIFDVTPSKFQNGMQAIGVIGQKDFSTKENIKLATMKVDVEVGRRRLNTPSSLAYDPVKNWLYVGDRGNERTLVFDVAPERLGPDPAALFVLGQKDFVTDVVTNAEQEEIIEPRELAVDPKAQRVYHTDAPMGRVVIFDLPRSERPVNLAPRAMATYATTDPWNGRERPELDKRKDWAGRYTPNATQSPGAQLVLMQTQQFRHPLSQRRSRVLVSETTVQAPTLAPLTSFFVDEAAGSRHLLVVTNGNAKPVDATISFQSGAAKPTEMKRSVPASGRLEITLSELFSSIGGQSGVLRINGGKQGLGAVLLRETRTSRGETLQMSVPSAAAFDSADGAAIAGIKSGGGFGTEIVLVNGGAKKIEGDLNVLQALENGEPVKWSGATFPMAYSLEAGGVLHLKLTSSSPLAEEAYAVVKSRTGNTLPAATAIVSQKKGDLILSQTATAARPQTQLAWMAVDTVPNLIRHGQTPSRMVFSVANSNRLPALIRFTLFDQSGKELGRYEQIMGPNNERQWSLPDLFNVQQVRGSVRFYSDVPVALSAKRLTTSLRGETIESEQGYVDVNMMKGSAPVALPLIWDGAGMASEIVLMNPTPQAMAGQLRFNAEDGAPSALVLR
jgi:DNA-binding beta-propeller fold protein YncE